MESMFDINQEVEAVSSEKTKFHFNPFDKEFHINPYPTYHRLRAKEPVHRNFLGSWVLTRYADVKFVLRDSNFRSDNLPQRLKNKNSYLEDRHQNLNALVSACSKWLLYIEPPDHTRMRSLVGKFFYPEMVERLRPQIQHIVDELIGNAQLNNSMDIISELARPLPVRVISKMLGVPEEIQNQVYKWAEEISTIFDPLNSLSTLAHMNEIVLKFTESFREVIAQREKEPQQDLISFLITARNEGDKLSNDEILSICMLLFGTGEETTVNLIGNGMLALLHHPEQMEKLKQQPAIIQNAVEELLRYDSPIQGISRTAIENIEIGNKEIKAGDQVIVYLGAANRDPKQFYEPDCLDLTRNDNRHLAFADGIHYCLGAALARVEAQVAINTLIQRLHNLQLYTDTLEWRTNINLRGLKSLPVTFSYCNS
ncbi:cytochrome P-450 like protein [Dulcicalothrix desertica PCC 7102]|uniref:Cytochrome P-450 like protein n=1 Tax=Dulcicalothrix desertica PCC 7102 TaxID=232991 RepID=A0A433VDT1_9CYAN|nr:cytochrome P450 [Dulcicalothrix desertica]RUT04207.1 cytochrome P-450 like protein [Dulcicalothrix desertica PCC 7102]TWH44215.1 hypothetical protein CAL7102_08003 [Dulcicalothrix desertica PCC 7102]TWH51487.1 hypothetical protein CAL7102_05913 [Dulcicalothrix desertica PCC 7102]